MSPIKASAATTPAVDPFLLTQIGVREPNLPIYAATVNPGLFAGIHAVWCNWDRLILMISIFGGLLVCRFVLLEVQNDKRSYSECFCDVARKSKITLERDVSKSL